MRYFEHQFVDFQHLKPGVEQFFRREVQAQFFDSSFDSPDSMRLVKCGDISTATIEQLDNRLQLAGQLFDDLAREDHSMSSDQRRGTSMIWPSGSGNLARSWRWRGSRMLNEVVRVACSVVASGVLIRESC